jgi:hypothetical protein
MTMQRKPVLVKAAGADLRPKARRVAMARAWVRSLRKAVRGIFGGRVAGTRHLAGELARRIEARDWERARDLALELGELGETRGDRRLMMKAGRTLRRLGDGARAWQLLSLSKAVPGQPEWDGGDLAGRTLLIDRRKGDLSIFLEFASLLKPVAQLGGRAIVLVEPRIAPLYRRTFPSLEVRLEGDPEARAQADLFAGFETLAWHFWPNEAAQRTGFVPLLPDPEEVKGLRAAYLGRERPALTGFAWGSLNRHKEVPSLADWAGMLTGLPGRIVSLQYGDVGPALAELQRRLPGRVLHDPKVDQLVDMDRFAAQIGALDAVVTISNTGAHLAGAMGVPCVVVLDDQFRLSWPRTKTIVPAYPQLSIVRRNGRSWSAVMADAGARLEKLTARLAP